MSVRRLFPRHRRRAAFAVLAVTMLAAPALRAESRTSALSWVRLPGAESCIATGELGERIERHLGRAVLVSPSVADLSIEGRVVRTQGKFKVTVGGSRRDGTPIGTRELASATASCREIDDALVLAIALMIDPDALAPKPPPKQDEPHQEPAPITREIVHERTVVHEVERVPESAPPWLVQGILLGAASVERLPAAGIAGNAALRFGPHRLAAVEVSFGTMPAQSLEVDGRIVEFSLYEGGLAYAPSIGIGSRVEIGASAGMRAGAIHSRGKGFAANSDVDRGLADVAVGVRGSVRLVGPLFVLASATTLVPLVRQETTVRDGASLLVLHRRSAVGADFGLGVGIHFSP